MAHGENQDGFSRHMWSRPDSGGGGRGSRVAPFCIVHSTLGVGLWGEAATIPGNNMTAEKEEVVELDGSPVKSTEENGGDKNNSAAGSDKPADPAMPAHSHSSPAPLNPSQAIPELAYDEEGASGEEEEPHLTPAVSL